MKSLQRDGQFFIATTIPKEAYRNLVTKSRCHDDAAVLFLLDRRKTLLCNKSNAAGLLKPTSDRSTLIYHNSSISVCRGLGETSRRLPSRMTSGL